jgi:hypothetical protein
MWRTLVIFYWFYKGFFIAIFTGKKVMWMNGHKIEYLDQTNRIWVLRVDGVIRRLDSENGNEVDAWGHEMGNLNDKLGLMR